MKEKYIRTFFFRNVKVIYLYCSFYNISNFTVFSCSLTYISRIWKYSSNDGIITLWYLHNGTCFDNWTIDHRTNFKYLPFSRNSWRMHFHENSYQTWSILHVHHTQTHTYIFWIYHNFILMEIDQIHTN